VVCVKRFTGNLFIVGVDIETFVEKVSVAYSEIGLNTEVAVGVLEDGSSGLLVTHYFHQIFESGGIKIGDDIYWEDIDLSVHCVNIELCIIWIECGMGLMFKGVSPRLYIGSNGEFLVYLVVLS